MAFRVIVGGLHSAMFGVSLVALLASPAGAVEPVRSVSDPVSSGDIVVTARRREESLQTVPISVTVATPAILKEQKISSAQDLQNLAPSLTVTSRVSQQQSGGFNIRGQGQPFQGALASVITYFADVPLDSQGGAAFALYDIDSVQVLRGPQGTLFGRNTNGGAVLFPPTPPGREIGGYADASYGNLDAVDIRAAFDLPLSDALRLRVAGNMIRRDGYVKNLAGRDFNDQHQDSWRIFLRFEPNDSFRNDLVYNGLDANEGGSGYILSALRAGKLAVTFNGGALVTALAEQRQRGPRAVNDNQEGLGGSRNIHLVANTTTLGLGNVTLKNIAAYERIKVCFGTDHDGTSVPYFFTSCFDTPYSRAAGFEMHPDTDLHQFTDEFQVSGTALDKRLDYIVAAFYLLGRSPGGLDRFRASRNSFNGSSATAVSAAIFSAQVRDESKAVFAQVTHHAGADRDVSITGGLRYTWDTREASFGRLVGSGAINTPLPLSRYSCQLPGVGASPATPIARCYSFLKGKYDDIGYNLSVDWKVTPGLLLYATTRRGFKDGGFNLLVASANDPEFQPETVTDYEIGAKWTYDPGPVRGRLNVDAFTSKYKDIQRQVTGGVPVTAVILNVGDGRIKGLEAEGLIQAGGFSLSAFYAYLRAKYDGGFIDSGVNVSASKFIGVPSHSGGFTARWEHELSAKGDAILASATVYATSRIALDSDTILNVEGVAPGYATLSGRLEWRNVGGRNFDLALWGRNITDKLYIQGAAPLGNSSGITSYLYGEPRTYGVQASVRF